MANLIYLAIGSLDGYIEDEQGTFDWAEPDGEVHAFVNDLVRPVGTYLYGRRMYETMVYWETDDDQAAVPRDYARIWRKAEKVVYSTTLQTPSSDRTRIERDFDVAAITRLKESSPREAQARFCIEAAGDLPGGAGTATEVSVSRQRRGGRLWMDT